MNNLNILSKEEYGYGFFFFKTKVAKNIFFYNDWLYFPIKADSAVEQRPSLSGRNVSI